MGTQEQEKASIFNVFKRFSTKYQENSMFFHAFGVCRQPPTANRQPSAARHFLDPGNNPNYGVVQHSKTYLPVYAKHQLLKKLASRLDKTLTFEVADPA